MQFVIFYYRMNIEVKEKTQGGENVSINAKTVARVKKATIKKIELAYLHMLY